MFIRTTRSATETVYIDAYTFDPLEWMALHDVLGLSGVRTEFLNLDRDGSGREGRRYVAEGRTQIESLQTLLQGAFDSTGRFQPTPNVEKHYACREITRTGMGSGCDEFAAPNDSVATVKCGIIAGQKSWFGGDSRLGNCGERGLPRG